DQIERAAAAALRILERLSGRMVQRKCGLGITHGRALAGRLGAHDLAVVDLYGPVVNLAFPLEKMTKAFGVGIVLSDAVAEAVANRRSERRTLAAAGARQRSPARDEDPADGLRPLPDERRARVFLVGDERQLRNEFATVGRSGRAIHQRRLGRREYSLR